MIGRTSWLLLGIVLLPKALCTQEHPPENPTTALLAEAAQKIDAKKWLDGIEQYQKVLDTAGNELVAVDRAHFTQARWVVHQRLAQLPTEALALYRQRIEAQAAKRVNDAKNDPTDEALKKVLAEMYCCVACEDAIVELARRAFFRGHFDQAAYWWRMLLPADADARLCYPQPKTSAAGVEARLLLVRLYQGERTAVGEALPDYQKKYPKAEGFLAGTNGPYAVTLAKLLAQPASTYLQPLESERDWPTFAGDVQRTGTLRSALPYFWPDQEVWRKPLPFPAARQAVDIPINPLHPKGYAFHPLLVNEEVLVADGASVHAVDARTGETRSTTLLPGGAPTPIPASNSVRHTLTVADGVVYVRMGGSELRAGDRMISSSIVALDPAPQGQLERPIRWQLAPPPTNDATTHFEGAPVVKEGKLYVGFWRQGAADPVSGVACYRLTDSKEPPTLLWQRVVGKTQVEGKDRTRHDLVSVSDDYVLTCTHGGSVVALDRRSGVVAWEYRYPRQENSVLPRYRDLCPVVVTGAAVLVAPADSDRLLCLDLFSGRLVWEREGLEVVHLLGVARGRVIVTLGGNVKGIRGFNLATGADSGSGGWTIHDDGGEYTLGRGLVSDDVILWPTKHGLHFLHPEDGRPLRQRLPGTFGNLCYADGYLIVTTATEVLGYIAERKRLSDRRKVRDADPANALKQLQYAKACLDAGAVEEVERSLGVEPKQDSLRWWLAEYLLRHGQNSAAKVHYDVLAQRKSDYAALAQARLIPFAAAGSAKAAWQALAAQPGSLWDERGVPVAAIAYANSHAPEQLGLDRPVGEDDAHPANALPVTRFERVMETLLDDESLMVLQQSTEGIITRGRFIQHFPATQRIPTALKPTYANSRLRGDLVLASADRIDFVRQRDGTVRWSTNRPMDGPRLTRTDRIALPVASGREPVVPLQLLHYADDSLVFLHDQRRVIEYHPKSALYSVNEPLAGHTATLVATGIDGGEPYQSSNGMMWMFDRTLKTYRAIPTTAQVWPQAPVPLRGTEVLLPADRALVLFDPQQRTTTARFDIPYPESSTGALPTVVVAPTKEYVLVRVERNHGTELECLTNSLRRHWPQPLFLGRTVRGIHADAEHIYLIGESDLRVLDWQGAERWRYPLPTHSEAEWSVLTTPVGLLLYPNTIRVPSSVAIVWGTIGNLMGSTGIALRAYAKSYHDRKDQEWPIDVLDPADGQPRQRLRFPLKGACRALAWVERELVVVTGHGCWILKPIGP